MRTIHFAESILQSNDSSSLQILSETSASFLLERSPTMRSIFYFAAEELYPNEIESLEKLTVSKLLRLFHPYEVACIISLSFVWRRIKRICPEEALTKILPKLEIQMRIGSLVGDTIQGVGRGNGILVGAIRYLSILLFSLSDPPQFTNYFRHLDKERAIFDLEYEEQIWHCNNLHLSGELVRRLGYSAPRSTLSLSFTSNALQLGDVQFSPEMRDSLETWRLITLWIEELHSTGIVTNIVDENHSLYLPPQEERQLTETAQIITKKGERIKFLTKSRSELSEKAITQLKIPTENKAEEMA